MITINMAKAREIKREQIRVERAPLLAALDIEYQLAEEVGDEGKKQEVAAKKRALRDAPSSPSIMQAKSPEDLKRISLSVIIGQP